MGILEVLQLVFIVLKLCNLIDWSWGVILIPLYIDIVLYALIILFKIFFAIADWMD